MPKPEIPFHRDDEGSVPVSTPEIAQRVLPKPERPFCTDDGASLPVSRLSEEGQNDIALEYNSVEDLDTHFASDLLSLDSLAKSSLASRSTVEPSSPDMQSYISRLKGRIDEALAHKSRGTYVKGDGSIPLESQERAWGGVLSTYEYPDEPNSRTDHEKWAFWAADFLRPDSTSHSPLIRELGMNIKYFAATSIKYQNILFGCGNDTSALVQEYKEGIALIEQMPGSPWVQLKSKDWERLAVDFIQRLMDKYKVSFPNSTKKFDKGTSMASKSRPKATMDQDPSASHQPSENIVTTILAPLKQKLAKVTGEMAHAKKRGLNISVLAIVREELQYLIKNSPVELTSQVPPEEWELMALHALTRVIGPPLPDQPQKPNVTLDSVEKPSTACSKPPSPTEQPADDYVPSSDLGSGEGRAVIPSSTVPIDRKNPMEEPAGPSGSTSSPPEPAGLMVSCRYQATPELNKCEQEKQKTDVVEGPKTAGTELERGEKLGTEIVQEKTEENHDEQITRQSGTDIVGQSPEVHKTCGTNAQAMDRTKKKEGDDECDNQGDTHERELEAMQAVGLDRDRSGDGKPQDITIGEPNKQKQVTHEKYGHTAWMDPKALAQDQLTWCAGSNAKVEKKGDFSPGAEQEQIDSTDASNEQPKTQVEIREERAESTSGSKNPAAAPEGPEKPTSERKRFGTLKLEVSDVKSDTKTVDAKKHVTCALEHKKGPTHEGEVSTSPNSSSSDAQFTPPGSETYSSPTHSGPSDIEDESKSPTKVSQAKESAVATRSRGSTTVGKKTYAALAKESASGSGSGVDRQSEAKSDPWAVPQGEQTWGRGKK